MINKKQKTKKLSPILKDVLSLNDKKLKKYLSSTLIKRGYTTRKSKSWLYAEGDSPVLLVAHLDTVHEESPETIYFDPKENVVWSPEGVGGDDRAGVYAVLMLARKHFGKPHVLFTDGEEKGAHGAKAAIKKELDPKVNVIVELDRREKNDAVYYGCGNKEIRKWVEKQGFEEAIGSFTDISVLAPAWDVAAVNLSVGYYGAHTTSEYIKINDLENTIRRVSRMISRPPKKKLSYDKIKTDAPSIEVDYGEGGWELRDGGWVYRDTYRVTKYYPSGYSRVGDDNKMTLKEWGNYQRFPKAKRKNYHTRPHMASDDPLIERAAKLAQYGCSICSRDLNVFCLYDSVTDSVRCRDCDDTVSNNSSEWVDLAATSVSI